MTFEERIDETLDCPHDLACLYNSSRCSSCAVASADGDNILFLKEKVPRFCVYKLPWGSSEVCRCPTRYGISTLFPSWGQRKNPIGFWKADQNAVILDANRCMEAILGIPHDQIRGACVLTDFPNDTIHHLLPFYDAAMNAGKTIFFENIRVGSPDRRQSLRSGWLIPRFKNQKFPHIICILENASEDHRQTELPRLRRMSGR